MKPVPNFPDYYCNKDGDIFSSKGKSLKKLNPTIKKYKEKCRKPRLYAHDVDDIISQSKFASLLEPTEDGFDVTRESAENLLATLRDKKPHLFARQHVPEMTTENPMVGDPAKKSIKEMSKDEILEARRKRLGLSSF